MTESPEKRGAEPRDGRSGKLKVHVVHFDKLGTRFGTPSGVTELDMVDGSDDITEDQDNQYRVPLLYLVIH